MSKIERLEQLVRSLYGEKDPKRTKWADWLYGNHVFVVADNAVMLAQRFGADSDLSRAAAMLHDIADAEMSRFEPAHEAQSLKIATKLMREAGYADAAIEIVVDDAIRYHSCHNGQVPKSLEGKVLAAADSLAHLRTDFYLFATWSMAAERSLADIKRWTLEKLERDYHAKILFDEVKAETQDDYEALKTLFSR